MDKNLLFSKCNYYTTVLHPLFTEKSQSMLAMGQYSFIVDSSRNKREISNAIVSLYNVKVKKIRVINYRCRKSMTNKGFSRHESGYKKALVFLEDGFTIDFEKLVN